MADKINFLGYKIVPLSPVQLEVRRETLNLAGANGWITPVLLLLTIYLTRRFIFSVSVPPSKPSKPSNFTLISRRMAWILNTTYVPEFGPLHVQLFGMLYTFWLVYLATRHTFPDYMHLAKSVAHVAASQLPLHYLLSFKHPRSPITLATGLTHERLNSYHRLLGRIIHALLATHAILYLRFFITADLLAKRIRDPDVRLGVLTFWAFNFLGLLSIPPLRRALYHKVFYRSHVILSALVLPALWFHVPYTRVYVAQAAIFWLLGGIMRRRETHVATLLASVVPGTNLIDARLAVPIHSALALASPGAHVYLHSGPLARNPFTVASVARAHRSTPSISPSSSSGTTADAELRVVARDLGGPGTHFLASLARTQQGQPLRVSLEGPYGEATTYVPALLQQVSSTTSSTPGRVRARSVSVLLVAGGIGATYALPIYVSLVRESAVATLVWVVRDVKDAGWGLEMLKDARQGMDSGSLDVRVFSTASESGEVERWMREVEGVEVNMLAGRPNLREVVDGIMGGGEDGSPGNGRGKSRVTEVVSARRREPDPRKLRHNFERITVMVCGPPGLTRDVRSAVGRHVLTYGRDVAWHEEQFGFGGS